MSGEAPIAVTGANGYIGRSLVKRLTDAGRPVRALLRNPASDLPAGVEHVVLGDFQEAQLRHALDGIDSVIHLAGRAHILHERASDPEASYRLSNTDLTSALGRAAEAVGVTRFVFMSTIKVHGDHPCKVLSESDEPVPNDAYSRSKLEAERELLRISRETGMEVTIIRSPLVYGPQCTGNVRRLSRLLMRKIPLPLGAIRNRRSMIGIDNLTDILILAATDDRAANETFVVSDGPPISTLDMIRSLSEGLGVKPLLVSVPQALLTILARALGLTAEIKRLCESLEIDSRKLSDKLSWNPKVTTHNGLVDAGRSFRQDVQDRLQQ